MVTINNVKTRDEGVFIEYTVNYEGTNTLAYGSLMITKEEQLKAFQSAKVEDSWYGFKLIVLTRLANESQTAKNNLESK